MDSLTFNDDGTVEFVVDDDHAFHLPRPKIRQFRDLSEAMERADAQFQALARGDWPVDVVELATQLAINDLGVPKGSAAVKKAAEITLADRTRSYGEMLFFNRILQRSDNPYPKVWELVLATLVPNSEITADDLPTWAVNPASLGSLREHWMAVPLRLGAATNLVVGEPPTTNTP